MQMKLRASVQYDSEKGIAALDNSLESIYITNPYGSQIEKSDYLIKEVVRVLVPGGTATFDVYEEKQKDELIALLNGVMALEEAKEVSETSAMVTVSLRKMEKEENQEISKSNVTVTPKFDEKNNVLVFFKASEERVVYYPVLSPWQLDADGHYFTPDAIAEACEVFNKNINLIDINHDFKSRTDTGDITIIKSFIAQEGDDYLNNEGLQTAPPKPGTWVVGLYCKSDEIWNGVKSGQYNAVSLAGSGHFLQGNVREVVFAHAA